MPNSSSNLSLFFSQHLSGKYSDTASRSINPIAPNGIITTPHYLASEAGLAILKEGGNAVNAAIAAASTLAVIYPQMNTIGGDNFWLIYNEKTKEVKALNASGRSGEKANIAFYKNQGFEKIPARGYLAANTVPGVVSGWDAAYQYARSYMNGKKIPWKKLFDDAISYAKNGFPVSVSLQHWSEINIDNQDTEFRNLQRFEEFRKNYLKKDGRPYQVGEIMKLPDLANSIQLIAKNGAKEFYQGALAKKMTKYLAANGGILTENDFANHRADWVTPLSVNYRNYKAYNLPPNTQGLASLEILNILNHFDLKKLGEGSADYYHLLIEATKEAFIDRDTYLSDPAFVKIPTDYLLSPEHGHTQAKRIKMDQASFNPHLMDPKGDTIWLGVVDKQGNAVSLIQSIYHDFGSAIIPKDTGILLQNRGSFFSLDPKHVNCLEPKKRTFHTLNAAMLLKDNKPFLVYGTMGGEGQPQTQTAIVTRIVDFGMYPQEAVSAPRWLYGRTWGASSNSLKIEGRIENEVISELKQRGHIVEVVDRYTDIMGHAGAILIDHKNHLKYGATDPRSDGMVACY